MTRIRPRTFVAPGKLMLAGEYSVLGPKGEALAVAVEPGIQVEATPRGEGQGWLLTRADTGTRWLEGEPVPEQLSFAQAALEEALAFLGDRAQPHRLTTGSSVPSGGIGMEATKPGLGGSASSAVAVATAVLGLAGMMQDQHRSRILELALRAHRRVQKGAGSGYDVATVVHGGLVRWRPEGKEVHVLPWPDGLSILAGYSGQSASTTRCLRQMERVDRARRDAALQALAQPARELIEAFARADRPAILSQVPVCHAALVRFDADFGLDLLAPAISRMVAIARSQGAVAKVSGAGGGDSVIALTDRREVREAVALAWQAQGFALLPVAISPGACERDPDAREG